MSINVRLRDDKVHLISLDDWLAHNDYLIGIRKKNIWEPTKKPKAYESYYLLTNDKLIYVYYTEKFTNFGMSSVEKMEYISYAKRDGVTEYLLFDKKEEKLKKYLSVHKYSKITVDQIKQLQKARKLIPKYSVNNTVDSKNFEDYLIASLYKSNCQEMASKYVVLDIETNGLRKASDDLISISIYDPLSGICYNRILPLHMQPLVLTSRIHGINNEDVANAADISQSELDKVINFFDLNNRTILTYSGGKGTFDSDFFKNYCKRQGLKGFENFIYKNIKNLIPKPGFGYEGELSKDNICKILDIEGVTAIHSSLNDCLLEWKLFEKLKMHRYFFIDGSLYNYSDKYIVPITYLINYSALKEIANIKLPIIVGKLTPIFTYKIPKKLLNVVKKYPTNITGIALEHGINFNLNIEKQDNLEFLIKNKQSLEYIGSLTSKITEIPIIEDSESSGLIAVNKEDENYIKEVNNTTQILVENFSSLFDYIKNNVFKGETIKSQELVISKDKRILAVCDLSSKTSILEIKTYEIKKYENNIIKGALPLQLFYEFNNRNIYLLSIEFKKHVNKKDEEAIDGIEVNIYKVQLKKVNDDDSILTYKLTTDYINTLKYIKNNPKITQKELSCKLGYGKHYIYNIFKTLKSLGYIKRKNNKSWEILRSTDDTLTKIISKNGAIEVYKETC